MTPQTYSAQNASELQERSKNQGGLSVILDLDANTELIWPASKWSAKHLLVYRLLVKPERAFIPAFQLEHRQSCCICYPERESPHNIDQSMVDVLLDGPPNNHLSERELYHTTGGFLWVSLDRARSSYHADEVRTYPKRQPKPVPRPDFVDSSAAIKGSSSPHRPSSSEYEAEFQHDEDENDVRRCVPETESVNFSTNLFSFVYQFCLVQETHSTEVRARTQRRTATASIANVDNVSCEDDGGICRVLRRRAGGWEMTNPYLALLEGKRAFKHLHIDNATGQARPMILDDALAQYLGEAVLTWRANEILLKKGVILVAVCGTFMRFIHISFGRRYREYLDATTVEEQRLIIQESPEDTCAIMESSKWYSQEEREGRKAALCHLLALPLWYEKQDDEDMEME